MYESIPGVTIPPQEICLMTVHGGWEFACHIRAPGPGIVIVAEIPGI